MVSGADASAVKRHVLHVIGGRPYQRHVPQEMRVAVMQMRTRANRKELDRAALGAAAVANYLRGIGDTASADRWDEMSSDMSIVARQR